MNLDMYNYVSVYMNEKNLCIVIISVVVSYFVN